MQRLPLNCIPKPTTAGDAVFGLAPGCLGLSAVAPAELLAPMPSNLSFAAAATTPTVYITAMLALQQGGVARPGRKVGVCFGRLLVLSMPPMSTPSSDLVVTGPGFRF